MAQLRRILVALVLVLILSLGSTSAFAGGLATGGALLDGIGNITWED